MKFCPAVYCYVKMPCSAILGLKVQHKSPYAGIKVRYSSSKVDSGENSFPSLFPLPHVEKVIIIIHEPQKLSDSRRSLGVQCSFKDLRRCKRDNWTC